MQEAKSEVEVNDILTINEFVVLDFWAPWCGPCKAMMPTLQKLSEEFSNVTFVKVNVNSSEFEGLESLCGRYSIKAVPTLAFFSRGEVSKVSAWIKTEGMIRDMIKELIS